MYHKLKIAILIITVKRIFYNKKIWQKEFCSNSSAKFVLSWSSAYILVAVMVARCLTLGMTQLIDVPSAQNWSNKSFFFLIFLLFLGITEQIVVEMPLFFYFTGHFYVKQVFSAQGVMMKAELLHFVY